MKKILIAVTSALALAAGSAWANDSKKADDKAATPSVDSKATTPSVDSKAATPSVDSKAASATDIKAPSDAKSVTGDVQSVDVPKMAITIVSPTGDVQHVIVAADAPVMRDGTASSFDQIKQGDNVRASLDSKSNKASKIEVKSKAGTAPQK